MIIIKVDKEELEEFLDSIKTDYGRLKREYYTRVGFVNFKKYFCNGLIKFKSNTMQEDFCKIYNEGISKKDSPNFFKKLRKFIIQKFTENIYFCPYCGKAPLIHFDEGNRHARLFQFDHFFPRDDFHEGIINFYNLIPSCNACNHLKGDHNPLDIIKKGGTVFHPYFGNLYLENGILKKDYSYNADIRLNFFSKNSKFYKLGKKYLNSEDTFNEFNFISDKRNKILAEKMLIKKYGKLMKWKKQFKSDEELKDYFFNGYYSKDEQDILKHSNGKLKKDLIGELDLSI